MKKTPVITLNFKKYRTILVFPSFFLIILFTFSLSRYAIPIKSETFINEMFFRACFALSSKSSLPSVFPELKSKPIEKRKEIKKEDPVKTSSPPLKVTQKKISADARVPDLKKAEVANNTSFTIDKQALLTSTPEFLSEDFSVLILHTHTTESYRPTPENSYTPTDTDRTTDENYNVIRIGKTISDILSKNNIKVYHDKTLNDYPGYNGSYNRSLSLIQKHLKRDSSIKVILDVHRDAVIGNNGESIRYISSVDGKDVASLMLVVGSSESGLKHDQWQKNMAFALSLQSHVQTLYPGLMRPINLRKQRFNQHLAPGGVIVEVGTNANTLEEALLGAEYFSKALASYLTQ